MNRSLKQTPGGIIHTSGFGLDTCASKKDDMKTTIIGTNTNNLKLLPPVAPTASMICSPKQRTVMWP
jgi:hypothetical protein